MIYRRLLMIFVVVALSEPAVRCLAQTWSDPIRFEAAGGIELRWRDFFLRSDTVAHFVEWEFANKTDSSATFEYKITSNKGEARIGRVVLGPQKRKLGGWYFTGESITDVSLRNVISGNSAAKTSLGTIAIKRK